MKKYKFIDLFAGCGGLEDGFLQSGRYIDIAAVEWLKPQVNTLIRRLETKWKVEDAAERVMHFDIQRETELFAGWDDEKFGSGKGLDYFVNKAQGIDVIIGGPPCHEISKIICQIHRNTKPGCEIRSQVLRLTSLNQLIFKHLLFNMRNVILFQFRPQCI